MRERNHPAGSLPDETPRQETPMRSWRTTLSAFGPAYIWRGFVLLLLTPMTVNQLNLPTHAQTSWEVTPYDIGISITLEPAPELHDHLHERLCSMLVSQSRVLVGPAWSVTCERTPKTLSYGCLRRLKRLSIKEIEELYPEALKRDKTIFVAVQPTGLGFLLQVRELDARARVWGRWEERQVLHSGGLPEATVDAVIDAFSPLAQIGKPVESEEQPSEAAIKKLFTVRFRAGALVTRADSPVLVGTGAVLQPIMRRNDRLGLPKPGGVNPVPWTFLTLLDGEGSERVCRVHSGMRNPISGKISRRVDRLALAIKPVPRSTRLQLRSNSDAERKLAGYEIYSRQTSQDKSENSEFLGQSDVEGWVTVPLGPDGPGSLRILYVKNGGELLARLPVLPGLEEEMSVSIFDDSARLEAEGFLRGLQASLVDRVVEREFLVARIRRRITADKFDEARKLLNELRSLKLPSHLAIDVANERGRRMTSDARTQAKINKLFSETDKALRGYADARDVEQLTSELDAAAQAETTPPAEPDAAAQAETTQPVSP